MPLDRGAFDRDATGDKFYSGVWRYQPMLPRLPVDAIVSRAEGRTPIYWDERIASYAGVRLLGLKHEGQNPTASFKAVSYTHLRAHETPEQLVCRLLLEKKKNKHHYVTPHRK